MMVTHGELLKDLDAAIVEVDALATAMERAGLDPEDAADTQVFQSVVRGHSVGAQLEALRSAYVSLRSRVVAISASSGSARRGRKFQPKPKIGVGSYACGGCGESGHNRRTCPTPRPT